MATLSPVQQLTCTANAVHVSLCVQKDYATVKISMGLQKNYSTLCQKVSTGTIYKYPLDLLWITCSNNE